MCVHSDKMKVSSIYIVDIELYRSYIQNPIEI